MTELDFRIERNRGRLIEARVFALRSRADTDRYSAALTAEVRRSIAPSVLCADHRPVRIYPPEAAERLVELFGVMNSLLERVAIVVAPSNAILLLQLERIVREAGYVKRRVFRAAEPAILHLGGGLDTEETQQLTTFLAEHKG